MRCCGTTAAMLALLLTVGLAGPAAAANPDPTSGRPPAAGTDTEVDGFDWRIDPVGDGTDFPLAASWRTGCPISREQLRAVTVSYWDFEGVRQNGTLVVRDRTAAQVIRVFSRLYDLRFQIERIQPVDAYGGNDDASMADNNTSAFNCRRVAGSRRWSEHAFGEAIDVNPIQNPYVKGKRVSPPAGRSWLDRRSPTPAMVQRGDATVRAFAVNGFRWGGSWRYSKDYQHFSTSGR
jgi:hypothetical protein